MANKSNVAQPALILSGLRRSQDCCRRVTGPRCKKSPLVFYLLSPPPSPPSLLTRASLDLPRVKSYGRTDGQVTQTDAAHLSRFEWSERDHTGWDRSTEGREGLEKEGERTERETGLRAAVGRPRRTGREFSDERDSPSRRASRWRRSICCSFFSYPLVRPSPAPQGPPLPLLFLSSFSFITPKLSTTSSLFFVSFFHRFFISRLISRFRSPFLSLSFFLDFFFALYLKAFHFQVREILFFRTRSRVMRVFILGTDQVNFFDETELYISPM